MEVIPTCNLFCSYFGYLFCSEFKISFHRIILIYRVVREWESATIEMESLPLQLKKRSEQQEELIDMLEKVFIQIHYLVCYLCIILCKFERNCMYN